MPIYVYECEKCGEIKEALVLAIRREPSKCACGGTMRRTVAGHAKTPSKWTV